MRAPKNLYPNQVIGTNPDYPLGKAKNDASPGDKTGSPLEEKWVNELWGHWAALLAAAGITYNGVPETVSASQLLDAIVEVGGRRLARHSGMQEWSAVNVCEDAGNPDMRFNFLVASRVSSTFGARQFLVAAGENSGPHQGIYRRSMDGSLFEQPSGTVGTSTAINGFDPISGDNAGPVLDVAPGMPGEFLASCLRASTTDVYVRRVKNFGIDANDSYTPTGDVTACFFSAALNCYFIATAAGAIEKSGAGVFSGWSSSSLADDFEASSSGYGPGGQFVESASEAIFCASGAIGGVPRFRIWRNTGAGWVLKLTGDAGWTSLKICRSEDGNFYALASTGALYKSADGDSWALTYTTGVTTAVGAVMKHGTFVSAGRVLAQLVNLIHAPDHYLSGVLYSMDQGATWSVALFGQGWGSTNVATGKEPRPLTGIVAANGRLYATDTKYVFRSGVVAEAPVLLTS